MKTPAGLLPKTLALSVLVPVVLCLESFVWAQAGPTRQQMPPVKQQGTSQQFVNPSQGNRGHADKQTHQPSASPLVLPKPHAQPRLPVADNPTVPTKAGVAASGVEPRRAIPTRSPDQSGVSGKIAPAAVQGMLNSGPSSVGRSAGTAASSPAAHEALKSPAVAPKSSLEASNPFLKRKDEIRIDDGARLKPPSAVFKTPSAVPKSASEGLKSPLGRSGEIRIENPYAPKLELKVTPAAAPQRVNDIFGAMPRSTGAQGTPGAGRATSSQTRQESPAAISAAKSRWGPIREVSAPAKSPTGGSDPKSAAHSGSLVTLPGGQAGDASAYTAQLRELERRGKQVPASWSALFEKADKWSMASSGQESGKRSQEKVTPRRAPQDPAAGPTSIVESLRAGNTDPSKGKPKPGSAGGPPKPAGMSEPPSGPNAGKPAAQAAQGQAQDVTARPQGQQQQATYTGWSRTAETPPGVDVLKMQGTGARDPGDGSRISGSIYSDPKTGQRWLHTGDWDPKTGGPNPADGKWFRMLDGPTPVPSRQAGRSEPPPGPSAGKPSADARTGTTTAGTEGKLAYWAGPSEYNTLGMTSRQAGLDDTRWVPSDKSPQELKLYGGESRGAVYDKSFASGETAFGPTHTVKYYHDGKEAQYWVSAVVYDSQGKGKSQWYKWNPGGTSGSEASPQSGTAATGSQTPGKVPNLPAIVDPMTGKSLVVQDGSGKYAGGQVGQVWYDRWMDPAEAKALIQKTQATTDRWQQQSDDFHRASQQKSEDWLKQGEQRAAARDGRTQGGSADWSNQRDYIEQNLPYLSPAQRQIADRLIQRFSGGTTGQPSAEDMDNMRRLTNAVFNLTQGKSDAASVRADQAVMDAEWNLAAVQGVRRGGKIAGQVAEKVLFPASQGAITSAIYGAADDINQGLGAAAGNAALNAGMSYRAGKISDWYQPSGEAAKVVAGAIGEAAGGGVDAGRHGDDVKKGSWDSGVDSVIAAGLYYALFGR